MSKPTPFAPTETGLVLPPVVESACTANPPAEGAVKPLPANEPESSDAVLAVCPSKVPPKSPSPSSKDCSTAAVTPVKPEPLPSKIVTGKQQEQHHLTQVH